ncbi:PREDICTED: protein ANTI-SILENCING 1-like isoform X2 [Ipomoea nil]|uniref:protein ANTI-SILENCING 1-like isoform X2 n=1 Tax=Ipomoea nil TaxID=35883 RepID=UPI00090178C0|nr:PREDICTED: protein ANTI-SILENCING 1-like isoform X2 [Ipomoea nil]
MLLPQEVNEKGGGDNNEGELQFNWGRKTGVQYYLSFTYNGVHYSLYDCVYMRRCDDEPEPGIGKLVKMFETATGIKKVKVVWFFRPAEVQNLLGDIRILPNELFLASGEGKGVFSLNLLENICGKCSVICISKDRRNPQPTKEESRKAKYVFFRAFDVKTCRISKIFPDVIAEVEVKNYFNQRKDSGASDTSPLSMRKIENISLLKKKKRESALDTSLPKKMKVEKHSGVSDKSPLSMRKIESISPLKKKKRESALDTSSPKKMKVEKHSGPSSRPKTSQGKDSVGMGVNLDRKVSKFAARADHTEKKKGVITNSQTTGVARRPDEDSIEWFTEQPWEIKMPMAQENGTLVLLENLDPSFNSKDVEDILWHVFKMKVSAKIERSTFSTPHSGKALAIFKSKEAAESVISDLKTRCLVLGDGRPLIAQTGVHKKPSNPSVFVGHLTIGKTRPQRQRPEMRMALSTSHHSQSNTIEYEMAIEWFVLQQQSDRWWKTLYEKHAKEIAELKNKVKIPS